MESSTQNQKFDDDELDARQVWLREDERWELTWPIWHMLPRQERKTLANKHGFDKIGEFEEWMSLQQAERDTTGDVSLRQPSLSGTTASSVSSLASSHNNYYPNNLVLPPPEGQVDHIVSTGEREKTDLDEASDVDESSVEGQDETTSALLEASGIPTEELLSLGGQILVLPAEILHRCFSYLAVDAYATLALVSPHWKPFTRTEAVYKRLCERLYLHQSKKRELHVSRFGYSYRNMLLLRPRVRANGGVYVMKYSRVKPIQRDMWTEVPVGAILETTYYRYLYFQEDGRVLYALTTAPPHEMFRRLRKVCLQKASDDAAVWGTYEVAKRTVSIHAVQPWQHVRLRLTIQPNTIHGRYGYLSFDKHETSSSGDFDMDKLDFDVPDEPFRFVRDRRL